MSSGILSKGLILTGNKFNSRNRQKAFEILLIVFQYRRSLEDAHELRHYCDDCQFPHLDRIEVVVERAKQVHFVLPAFPAKSPNKFKVIGNLPDKAEWLALNFLQSLCDEIKAIYTPGATITICSDGRVFSDLVGVADEDVTGYQNELAIMISEMKAFSVNLFNLDGAFEYTSFDDLRRQTVQEFGVDIESIQTSVKEVPREKILFNGLERFMFEDQLVLNPEMTRNKVRKRAHELTYLVIQRSHAWSKLVEQKFPDSVRLSIHPQPCHHTKLGIQLMQSKDNWITPWHGVAVKTNDGFKLMKRQTAEELGAVLVTENERPSYFLLDVKE